MLWQKESRELDALYNDIITPNAQHWDSITNLVLQKFKQEPHPEKSNAIALKKRNFENALFRDSVPLKAMASYSDSLRFAEPGSEHISLAYANRAACFLKMKMYDECLIDIDYALAAGYPEQLRPKLKDRKAKCLAEMQKNPQNHEKLSIEPDEKFPYLSNVAKVQQNENGDYSMVATTDIDVVQPIAIEVPFNVYARDEFEIHCNICAKPFCNLVPCEQCAVAMFCPECQGHFLHEYECGLNFCGKSEFNSDVMNLVRSILLVLKMFPTVDELISFVEQILERPNELPPSMLRDRSTYQVYLNSPINKNIKSLDHLGPLIHPVYKTLLRIPYVSETCKTTKHRRFLMHLIGHHAKIPCKVTGFSLNADSLSPIATPIQISPVMDSYMKHSCYPNVRFVMNGSECVWHSVKPIKKGEQLFISQVPSRLKTTNERKKYLLHMLNINCECLRCQGKVATSAQRQQLVSDPAFRYIQKNGSKVGERLMDACVTVLQEYGQMDWCDEMEYVLKRFRALYKIRSIGGVTGFNHPLFHELLMGDVNASAATLKLNDL